MKVEDIKIETADDVLALRWAVLVLVDGLEAIVESTEEDYQQIAAETLEVFHDTLR